MSFFYILLLLDLAIAARAHPNTTACVHASMQTSARYWNSTSTTQHWPTSGGGTIPAQMTGTPRHVSKVTVGAAGELVFSPSTLNASIGTLVQFDFLSRNHTLSQSEFWDPCHSNGGYDTGFNQFNPQNQSGKFVVEFEVTTDKPQWFFCSQTVSKSHCRSGMVFSLNARGSENSFLQNAFTDILPSSAPPTSIIAACPTYPPATNFTGRIPSSGTGAASLIKQTTTPTSVMPPITNTGSLRRNVNVLGLVVGFWMAYIN